MDPTLFAKYEFSSRMAKYHRVQIREELGFRECSMADQAELTEWLSREHCPTEFRREQLRDAVIARCRATGLEPPSCGQVSRLVASAVRGFEDRFCGTVEARLDTAAGPAERLEALVGRDDEASESVGGGKRFLQ